MGTAISTMMGTAEFQSIPTDALFSTLYSELHLLARRQLARFYLTHDRPGEALPHLRVLSTSPSVLPEDAAWARRMLATLPFQLAVLGNPSQARAVSG